MKNCGFRSNKIKPRLFQGQAGVISRDHVAHSCGLNNRVTSEVKVNWPLPAFVVRIKPALNQITDHHHQFIQIFALRGHFRLVATRHQPVVFPLDLKDEFFVYGTSLPLPINFYKGERPCASRRTVGHFGGHRSHRWRRGRIVIMRVDEIRPEA
jgi:hypothetical protein